MNAVQLKQAITVSLTKQVQETVQAQAAIMLEDFANIQQILQQNALSPHPSLGKVIDVSV
ncbi:hypothetical protein P9578_25885 [Brevibacillus choshinensis]|uniref:hypothetical protein n=1 Tax=Brevibacillus choshinensis TaxID=54911 RepID=UPI002E1F5E58|nr:hypothetical protein [Brevibacillus choshinensis]